MYLVMLCYDLYNNFADIMTKVIVMSYDKARFFSLVDLRDFFFQIQGQGDRKKIKKL